MTQSFKVHCSSITRCLFAAPLVILAVPSIAADRFWDGGTVNIAANGDGLSTFAAGNWNTTLTNWDQGSGLAHVAWDNAALDNAIFGGTFTAAQRIVDLTSDITVNQIRIVTGSTGNSRYDIGAAAETNSIFFGGTYNDTTPAYEATGAQTATGHNNQLSARITGTINGGLVIKYQSDITTPAASGRLNLTNAANDFTGDVTMLSGNLHVLANLGNAANKIILKGGALFTSNGAAVTQTNARNIEVAAASGISTNATTAGVQAMQLTGAITGSGDLTRYNSSTGTSISEVRFQGDLSGYTGMIENRGGVMVGQTTATSGGVWRLTGGTLRLDAANNDVIASGAGKSDLLMNAGTLNLNGRNETINGLSGAAGFVQNELSATTSTLTLGDGDATASFGGTIRNNAGTGGTLALTKIGSGTQTLSGTNTYGGITTVTSGTLLLSGSLTVSNLSVSGTIGGSGSAGGSASLSGGTIDPGGDGGDRSLNFDGPVSGSGIISLTIDSPASYDRITGAGLVDASAISLSVTMNDSGWTAATDAASLATATQYDIAANPVTGNFTNGVALTAEEQSYWGVGADSKFFNFGGQDFLLTTGSFKLTAVAPIPEPAAFVTLLMAAGLGVARRRR